MVAPGYQTINAVLQAKVFFSQLVQGGEERGDVKVAGLLHQKPASLLPVSLQKLLQGLRLASGVQHARHCVRLSFEPTNCLWSPTPARQGNTCQLRNQLRCVG